MSRQNSDGVAMELLLNGLPGGRYMYRPFSQTPADHSQKPPDFISGYQPSSLAASCMQLIRKRLGLRKLKKRAKDLGLPPPIMRKLLIADTRDYVELECAPFRDLFDFNIYHRSLTYRVQCTLDGETYMATHVGTDELLNSGYFWQWVWLDHPNIMSVYSLALNNNNVFLIMDVPETTLKSVEIFIMSHGYYFPERFLWRMTDQLTSAIQHAEKNNLSFGRFDLKNIYIIAGRVVLDNKLTWKSWIQADMSVRNRVQSLVLGDRLSLPTINHHEIKPSSAGVSVACLGFVITKLASVALIDRRSCSQICTPPNCAQMNMLVGLIGYPSARSDGVSAYSPDLFDLLVALHSVNPPTLESIRNRAQTANKISEVTELILTTSTHTLTLDNDNECNNNINNTRDDNQLFITDLNNNSICAPINSLETLDNLD